MSATYRFFDLGSTDAAVGLGFVVGKYDMNVAPPASTGGGQSAASPTTTDVRHRRNMGGACMGKATSSSKRITAVNAGRRAYSAR